MSQLFHQRNLSSDSRFPASVKHHGDDLHSRFGRVLREVSDDRESVTHNNFV